MNSKHCTHRSSKRIKTFQMSYVYIQCCNDVQIVKVQKGKYININIGCIYNVVCSSLIALFLWQQVTNRAAVIAHWGISPNRYGSLSKCGLFSNSLWVCVIRGK